MTRLYTILLLRERSMVKPSSRRMSSSARDGKARLASRTSKPGALAELTPAAAAGRFERLFEAAEVASYFPLAALIAGLL